MKNSILKTIVKFIFYKIIYRYKVFEEVKIDKGPEFKRAIIKELIKLEIKRHMILAYNSKANEIIKRRHQPIIVALIALTIGGKRK